MVGKKEYAQINELLNARLDAKKVLIAVHRGAWGGNIIEGTVPSLELALKMGADMFECDLSKSTDGVIYAFHDTQEPRLLKTKQNVKTMTSAEIDALEFYNSIDEPSGKHVQRFEEVVKYFTHGELFNIDRSWPILAETHELLKNYPHVVKQAIIKTPVKDEYLEFFQNCPVKYMYMPIVYNMEEGSDLRQHQHRWRGGHCQDCGFRDDRPGEPEVDPGAGAVHLGQQHQSGQRSRTERHLQ